MTSVTQGQRRRTAKRGNGEGSIYQRSDGRWCASVPLGNGKRKVLYGSTRKEVADKLNDSLRDAKRGLPLPGARLRTAKYLSDWLEQTVKPSQRPLTYDRYSSALNKHVIPAIGSVPLLRVEPKHVQKIQADMVAKGLSVATINSMRTALSAALTQAEKWNLVARNVVRLVDPPLSTDKEPRVLEPAEAAAFLSAAACDDLEQMFTAMLATGLRPGEARGLRWADVQADSIQVRQQIVELRNDVDRGRRCEAKTQRGKRCTNHPLGGKPRCALHADEAKKRVPGDPKSNHGKRSVPLIPMAAAALQAQRQRVLPMRLHVGPLWHDGDLVFPDALGRPLVARTVRDHFARIAAKAGIENATPHALRHSTGTFLLAAGVPDRVVQAILGHGSAAMTRLYQHVLPAMLTDAGARLAQFLNAGGF